MTNQSEQNLELNWTDYLANYMIQRRMNEIGNLKKLCHCVIIDILQIVQTTGRVAIDIFYEYSIGTAEEKRSHISEIQVR